MNKSKKSLAVVIGVAGAIAFGVTAGSAAPVSSSTVALKNAAPSDVIQTHSRSARRAAVRAATRIGATATSSAFAFDPSFGFDPAFAFAAPEPVFASSTICHPLDPFCLYGTTFAAPAPAFVEPAPIVRRRVVTRQRTVGPSVFAGPAPAFVEPAPIFAGPLGPPRRIPGSVCGSGSCSIPLNPALGTINGASAVD